MITTLLQVALVIVTGSVALLAETVHNFGERRPHPAHPRPGVLALPGCAIVVSLKRAVRRDRRGPRDARLPP